MEPTDLEVIGDINEDGYDDIRIGEEIKMGSESGEMRLWATTAYLQSVGDFDGDGYTDLAMGNPSWSSDRGRIWIRYGYEADYDVDGFLESEDCDDADATVYPAVEIVGDGIDNDCNGTEMCYADADNDGYADAPAATVASDDADCDDPARRVRMLLRPTAMTQRPLARPGGTEIPRRRHRPRLQRCRPVLRGPRRRRLPVVHWRHDRIGRHGLRPTGEATSASPSDRLRRHNPSMSPAATETPANGQDEDCNGGELCFVDGDDDGYREITGSRSSRPTWTVPISGEGSASEPPTDCNDLDATVNPSPGTSSSTASTRTATAAMTATRMPTAMATPQWTAPPWCRQTSTADPAIFLRPTVTTREINPGGVGDRGRRVGSELRRRRDLPRRCRHGRLCCSVRPWSDDTDCDDGEWHRAGDCDDFRSYPAVKTSRRWHRPTATEWRPATPTVMATVFRCGSLMLSLDADCDDPGEATDCERLRDSDPTIYPGAPEIVVDGIDQDCDGIRHAMTWTASAQPRAARSERRRRLRRSRRGLGRDGSCNGLRRRMHRESGCIRVGR